jgi:predicted RNA binding protein YcfA (HicA-like mRNA interferase family)
VSYLEAEKILFELGYELKVSGSHHVFRKAGFKHVTLKRRAQLLPYQITDLQEVLRDHEIKEKI